MQKIKMSSDGDCILSLVNRRFQSDLRFILLLSRLLIYLELLHKTRKSRRPRKRLFMNFVDMHLPPFFPMINAFRHSFPAILCIDKGLEMSFACPQNILRLIIVHLHASEKF